MAWRALAGSVLRPAVAGPRRGEAVEPAREVRCCRSAGCVRLVGELYRFKDNEARLQLFALAYNLSNFLRQLVLPKPIQGWTLTTLREKLIKIGAKVVRHSQYVLFQLAEVAVPRHLFARILGRIARLCPACASG
jgi:Transposase DDE domain group 1